MSRSRVDELVWLVFLLVFIVLGLRLLQVAL